MFEGVGTCEIVCCLLLQGYPYSPHGNNNSPPNMADQVNPPQANYFRRAISVGCSPSEAHPFAFQPHYVQHVDPNTGSVTKLIVVPAAMVGNCTDVNVVVCYKVWSE